MSKSVSKYLSVVNKTKGKLPRLPFVALKEAVLGKKYELSVAFVGNTESCRLNKIYRGKNKPANILSFPLSINEGEIVMCPSETRKTAKNFNRKYENFVPFLFIHGLFHLKGFSHSSTMESKEATVRKEFGIDRVVRRKK